MEYWSDGSYISGPQSSKLEIRNAKQIPNTSFIVFKTSNFGLIRKGGEE
jgi:hypothetical protein